MVNGKTKITLTRDVKERIKNSIKKNKYLIEHDKTDFQSVFSSINTYKHGYKYTDSKFVENTLNKYWYNLCI